MYNLRNKRVNRHCTTETSCRAQDLGRGSCVSNELQSPSANGGSSATLSRATATLPTEEPNQSAQPVVDASDATQVNMPQTTKAGKPRQRLKWTQEMNFFIMRAYYKITKFETDLSTYRYQLHRAFVEKFPHLSSITEQRIADQRRTIIKNNLIPEPLLQQIKSEIQVEIEEEDDILPNEINIANQPQIVEPNDNDTNTDRDNPPNIDENIENSRNQYVFQELCNALTEFEGTDPVRRPKLPKLRTNKQTSNIIKACNLILKDFVREYNTLEKLHTLIYCGAVAVLRSHNQQVYVPKKQPKRTEQRIPFWQRRLEGSISDIRKEMGRLTEYQNCEHPSKRLRTKVKKILQKVGIRESDTNYHKHLQEYLDTLRQKLKAKSKRLRRYIKCSERKRQNRLFTNNQKQIYREISQRSTHNNSEIPAKPQLTEFWSNIWSKPKEHNRNAHWIGRELHNRIIPEMQFENISEEDVTSAIKNTNNWKAPGADNIQNFWYKKFDSLHEALADKFNHLIYHPEDTPAFMMLGITYMLPKNERTHDPSQYRPITCLPTIYKLLTCCLTNKIYTHIESNGVLAEEQKGCKRDHQGCKEQLVIDTVILNQAQKKQRNIYTAFIDYQKAFDSVPHSWLLEVLNLYRVNPIITNFLATVMSSWRTSLHVSSSKEYYNTDVIQIRRGIFQGDSLSPLWFCLAMNPLSAMLNGSKYGFKIKTNNNSGYVISHLLYMDDIKLYAGTQKQLDNLIKITHNFSEDIHMNFGMEKCKTLNIEKGKIVNGNVALPNEDIVQAMEDGETYKYLGFQQARLLDDKQAKIKIKNEFLKRIRTLLRTELNAGNLTTGINAYAIPVLTYSFGIIRWTATEIEQLQRAIRTMMTKHNAHHPRASTIRTTLPRNDGGRALLDIANLHSRQLTKLREFFARKGHTSHLHRTILVADKNYSPLNLSNNNIELPLVSDTDKKEQLSQMALHGRHYYELQQPYINKDASNKWLSSGTLFPETEGFMIAIQDQVINTNNYRKFVMKDPSTDSDKCRRCRQKSETIQHVTAGCTYLANSDYLQRHNQVCNIIHQKLAIKYGLLNMYTPYYKYQPQPVVENNAFRLYYDRTIITDRKVTNNRPDIMLMDKRVKRVYLIDVAVPNNNNMLDKYQEKRAKYAELAIEIKQMWQMDQVEVIPIIVSSTGLIPKTLEESLTKIGLHKNTYIEIQKAVILSTCHLTRKFLQNDI